MTSSTNVRTSRSLRRMALAAAVALALPATAMGQSERELALEQRVAELERMVQSLVEQRQAATPAPAPEPEVDNPVQRTSIVGGAPRGTTFGFGGFIKANSMISDYTDGNPAPGSVGRDFYLPGAIPVAPPGPSGSAGTDPVYDTHAKQSRFWLTTDTTLDNGSKLGTRFEMDFAVPVSGNERSTNTYNPVLRRAYVTYDNWLLGQEWSNFMELGALPETTDWVGPTEGMVFVRQSQIRYTSGPWSVSIENPETTLMPNGGGVNFDTDQNSLPDFTARYRHTGDWGFFSVAGLLRQLKYETVAAGSTDDMGYGVSFSSKINFGADDLRLMATAGSGIGRYVGLGFFADGVLDGGGDIDALDVVSAYAAYRHVWGGSWRSNFILGYTSVDNPTAFTGLSSNASAQSARVNLMWSPVPKLDFGFELSTAKRELEDGRSGELNRIDFMGKYSF